MYLLLLASMYLTNRGREYNKLLKVVEQHMLLRQLDRDERGMRRTRDRADSAAELPTPPFHQGATGTIVLGIAIPLLVEVLKVVLGLAKLP